MLMPETYDSRFMKPVTLCRCGHILDCCADCRDWRVRPRKRCQYCGQPFVSRVKTTRFCSRDCARLFRLARLL